MKDELALVIIYNHKYDKNIDILEKIYGSRFSKIYHLVPFYEGDRENVIAVYESSYYFQGYLAQGFRNYFNASYKHYFYIADDMIVNPLINEDNYKDFFKLEDNASFIPELDSMPADKWPHGRAALTYNPYKQGVEIKNEIPAIEEAKKRITDLNVFNGNYSFKDVYFFDQNFKWRNVCSKIILFLHDRLFLNANLKGSQYPFARSYSDILIVSAKDVKKFVHYCGAFAATDLWVELAIPTALALASGKIVVQADLVLQGKPLWSKEDYEILDKYDNKLKNLLDNFPASFIYLHPIKLSKWNVDIRLYIFSEKS
jgi:hypothetical protein